MPFSVEASESLSYIRVIVTGIIKDEDLIQFRQDLFACQGFADKDQLVDYSGVTQYEITTNGLERYALRLDLQLAEAGASRDRKIAIVSPADLHFGMSRIFIAHTSHLPANYSVFRTLKEALDWLTITPAQPGSP